LIEAAVATWHDRAAVIELARAWLAQNQAAPAYPSMVALLTAITGLAEFYTLSEKLYAAAADDDRRSEFLRALLPRSYGHRKYVTAAVELITKDPQRRRGLQQYLGRAMIFGESVLGTGRSVLGALLRSEPAPTREILEESVFRAIRFDDVAHSVFIRRDIPLLPEPYPCKILGRLVQWKTYAGLDAQTRAAVFAATVTVLRSFPAGFVHLRQQLNWNQPLLAELLNVETIPSTVKRALQIAQASRR
jgi:hypothetical protein